MIDHISIQASDVAASAAFFDAVLAPLGGSRQLEFGEFVGFGTDRTTFLVGPVTTEGEPREVHVAFIAASRAAVEAFHAAALDQGAEVLNAPAVHAEYHPNYYAAFIRDLDGNNVEAVCHTE